MGMPTGGCVAVFIARLTRGIYIPGYVDDICLLVVGRFLNISLLPSYSRDKVQLGPVFSLSRQN